MRPMPAPRQVARFPALPQAASSFSSPASTPLGLLHCRRSAGLPADPRARFGQPDPDGWRSSRRRGGGAPFAVRRSCPSRQDGAAKTVPPRRCRQDGVAKTGSPRRGRQDGVAKTVPPRRCPSARIASSPAIDALSSRRSERSRSRGEIPVTYPTGRPAAALLAGCGLRPAGAPRPGRRPRVEA